jgi:pantetheine-phosphate adenylyltransferase
MKIAIYPGTFDPITNGHLDVLERATKLFDQIIVTVAKNTSKKPLFDTLERLDLIQKIVAELPAASQISVKSFDGLIVDYAQKVKASAIIRGLRAISDFEYEFQMALVNRKLSHGITTVFLMPHEKYTYLNSSIVKEVASFGGDISSFVPPLIEQAIKEKYQHLKK